MDSKKKFYIHLILLVFLCTCLCTVSFALGMVTYQVRENKFHAGQIKINLNGGNPIIKADDFLFEPGMTVEKPFYIRNNGTWDVYYKVYFSQISGDLGDVLEVTIKSEDGEVLLKGKLSELTKNNVAAFEDELAEGEQRDFIASFHFPEEAENTYQNSTLQFELSTIAVQTKNNENKEFE